MLLKTIKKAIKFNLKSINDAIDNENNIKETRTISSNKINSKFEESSNNIDKIRKSIQNTKL